VTDIARLIRENSHLVQMQMLAEIREHWDEIVDGAVERATTIGEAEYGRSSFDKSPSEIREERFAEYKDAVFYAQLERFIRRILAANMGVNGEPVHDRGIPGGA